MSNVKNTVTYEQLTESFRYDPDTGHLIRIKPVQGGTVGQPAGSRNLNGYIMVRVGGTRIAAHRLAFLAMTGTLPGIWVDHINHDRSDNRWANLRLATPSQNAHNARIRRDNVSGYKGVSWSNRHQKWYAQIMIEGKLLNLKYHDTAEEADAAVRAARSKYHTAFANHDMDSRVPLSERKVIRERRKPRTEKWTHPNRPESPSATSHMKASRIRKLARSGQYDPDVNALLSDLSCVEMMQTEWWQRLNTTGKLRKAA